MFEIIAKSQLFKGLNAGEIIHVFNMNYYQIKDYEAETIIAFSGAKCNYLYLLIDGCVRGEIIDSKGKTIVIEEIKAPDTFAEAFLFTTDSVLFVNVVACTNSKVLQILKPDFLKLIRNNQIIFENYLRIISDRFSLVTRKIRTLTLVSLSGKIANYFLEKEKYSTGKIFEIHMTHQQLADYFGVARPSLSRELSRLEKENILKIEKKEVKILDRQKLLELLN